MIARALVLTLFLVGLTGLILRRNLIKKVFALAILNSSIVILFTLEGSRIGTFAPLQTGRAAEKTVSYVDPMPQALMLTAIVVGVCVTALALSLAHRLYRAYGTLDADELRKLADHE